MNDRPSRRVLVLSPFPPRVDAHSGGSRVVADLLLELSGRHRIALACLREPDQPGPSEELVRRCARVEVVPRPARRDSLAIARRVAAGLTGLPAWGLHVRVPGFAERVRSLAREFSPDVVQIEFQVMAQYAEAAATPGAARVLVVHEPGLAAARERAREVRGPRRALRRVELSAWRRFEPRGLAQADAVIVFTERDRDALAGVPAGTPVHVVAPGTDLPEQPCDPVGDGSTVLFVGSFAHPPNVEAAAVLADAIMPAVRQRVASARGTIVGPDPPADLRRRADAYTQVTGRVPDVRPYLDAAAVVVAPLWSGGGMRVKVLEALAVGKALVATDLAVTGLDVVDGEHLLVAGTQAAFADAVAGLLEDPDRRRRLAAAARAWALEHLGRDHAARRLEVVWDEALAARGTGYD